MKRRPFVVSTATLGISALAGCLDLDDIDAMVDSATGDDKSTEDNSVPPTEYIEKVVFPGDGEMEIHFYADHDTDGFSILYQHHSDPIDDSILGGESPPFAGPIELPFREILEQAGIEFPTPTFQIKLLNGSGFGERYYEKELGGPEDMVQWDSTFDDDEVVFVYDDPQKRTTHVDVVIVDRFDEQNVIHAENHTGPFGELEVRERVPAEDGNTQWTIDLEAYRDDPPSRGNPINSFADLDDVLKSVEFTVPDEWND